MRAPRRVRRWLALAAASGSLASILSARGAFTDPAILAAAPAAVFTPLHSGLCATQASAGMAPRGAAAASLTWAAAARPSGSLGPHGVPNLSRRESTVK